MSILWETGLGSCIVLVIGFISIGVACWKAHRDD